MNLFGRYSNSPVPGENRLWLPGSFRYISQTIGCSDWRLGWRPILEDSYTRFAAAAEMKLDSCAHECSLAALVLW